MRCSQDYPKCLAPPDHAHKAEANAIDHSADNRLLEIEDVMGSCP